MRSAHFLTPRFFLLLIVVVVCALACSDLYAQARGVGGAAPPPDPEATPTPQPILTWEMDELRSIHISDGARTTRLERVDKEWRVVEPGDAAGSSSSAADPHTLYWPLLELAALEARLLVSEEVTDKVAYGLETPALTITIEVESGERERLYAGRETADGTAFYVQREGDPRLYIVDHYKVELLQEWLSSPPFKATPAPDG